jgi:hypothetical protein
MRGGSLSKMSWLALVTEDLRSREILMLFSVSVAAKLLTKIKCRHGFLFPPLRISEDKPRRRLNSKQR